MEDMMRAFRITETGRPGAIESVPVPVPGPGEVRIRIVACGLNFADLLMQQGTYQDTPAVPFTMGMEIAGIVEALGPGVEGPAPGTRVAAFAGTGGLAEQGCFPVDRVMPIPDAMSFEQAAGFQVAYGTSHVALDHRARLQPGETLLVLGAAGGVGLTAVEIGKQMGARVIAVARGADKLEAARAAGADHLIDATDADLRAELKALGGVDVVYDPVGGPGFRTALSACRTEARYLLIGFAGGLPEIPANHLLVKNVTVIGFWWGGHLSFNPKPLTDSLATLIGWHAEGLLHPHIGQRLPLARAAEGLAALRDRSATGKIVIDIPG
jgi:NADPH2:quinone reductase